MSPVQVLLASLSLTALYLVNRREERVRRWAPVFGLLAQPFWLASALSTRQYGMATVVAFYAAIWARALYSNFWRKT